MKYTVQQDNAGWVVVREGKPRRAWSHHRTKTEAQQEASRLNKEDKIT